MNGTPIASDKVESQNYPMFPKNSKKGTLVVQNKKTQEDICTYDFNYTISPTPGPPSPPSPPWNGLYYCNKQTGSCDFVTKVPHNSTTYDPLKGFDNSNCNFSCSPIKPPSPPPPQPSPPSPYRAQTHAY